MKKLLLSLMLAFSAAAAFAQHYYVDAKNPQMLRHAERHEPCRRNIILPQVNGYNVYKADLHTHTIFSDGQVLPRFRVSEAWRDGLDVMAVTEHIEVRTIEDMMVNYLSRYTDGKYVKGKNNRIGPHKPVDAEGIMVDLNYPVLESQKEGYKYGVTIIPGIEITRNGAKVGHFNALFTTDNNLIFDMDPVQSIRNAKAQGALVMHNHPGWTRENIDFTETEATAYGEGLIDGVEVMNGAEFYPAVIDRVRERKLFIAANSDVHGATSVDYRLTGADRPMTLILAKENTLDSLREALEARRTIAYAFNTLCGEEQLLKDFFVASVSLKLMPGTESLDKPSLMLVNNTSVTYVIEEEGKNQMTLEPFSTLRLRPDKGQHLLKLTLLNMFCSVDGHPVVELSF